MQPDALHLSRSRVARVPQARRISAAKALHLSAKQPISSMKTAAFRSLLFSSCIPCNFLCADALLGTRNAFRLPSDARANTTMP
jgi:hypothetical protein